MKTIKKFKHFFNTLVLSTSKRNFFATPKNLVTFIQFFFALLRVINKVIIHYYIQCLEQYKFLITVKPVPLLVKPFHLPYFISFIFRYHIRI